MCGSRSESRCLNSAIEVELWIGRDKVDGKSRPGNEVKKTLMVEGAILRTLSEELPLQTPSKYDRRCDCEDISRIK